MSDTLHLLVPYAASHHPGCQHTLQTLTLPHLDRLLRHLERQGSDSGDEDHPAMPHERALARALGLPGDGAHTPWAAWQVQQSGLPPRPATAAHPAPAVAQPDQLQPPAPGQTTRTPAWALVTPCHWQVGTDHITLLDPQALALDEAASRALLAIVAPWLESDGITLHYDQPTRWLAQGDWLAHLATPSLERVQGGDVRGWLQHQAQAAGHPDAQVQAAQTWQRLHSELQMLLYTHPFNDARSAQGLLPINAFWVHGAGRLEAPSPSATPWQAQSPAQTSAAGQAQKQALVKTPVQAQRQAPAPVQLEDALRAPALRQDWAAWASAWAALDAGPLAQLHAHMARGTPVQLTLCGQRSAITWHSGGRSLRHKITSIFRPQRFADVREQL